MDIENRREKEDGSASHPFTFITRAVRKAKEGARIIERRGHDLMILQSGCEVSGFFIKSEWSGTILGPAIQEEGVENVKMFNNKFYYADSSSIRLEKTSGKIFNTIMEDPRKANAAITLDYSSDIDISNNDIRNFSGRIGLLGSSLKIMNSHITNCKVDVNIIHGRRQCYIISSNI